MQEYKITVVLPDDRCEELVVPEGTNLEDIATQFQDCYPDKIVLAMFNQSLRELSKTIHKDGRVSFLTMTHSDGKRTYRRGVTLLMQRAALNLWGNQTIIKVFYSLGQGYYCERLDREQKRLEVTGEDIERLKCEMRRLVDADCPIKKSSVKTEEAERRFREIGMHDKERLLHYRRSSRVNLYDLDGLKDYFYGYMVPSTGYLAYFDIVPYEDGFVVLFPNTGSTQVGPLVTSNKLHKTLRASREWSRMLNIGSVGALNDAITAGRGQEMILTQEALMEERIGNLAAQIAGREDIKFVMIAGPSSSGKTSFANRLSIQLSAKGRRPHALSLDDYYADRELCPRNPDGTHDYECLEALDVEQFNLDMTRLLQGEEIDMPSFNFKTGKREYRNKKLRLQQGDILVIEVIHGLNDKLSYMLPAESKFKIYISALTQLNVDENNPLPTTDGRLLRRIVRDARTRGTNAQETIAMWPAVRKGEEQNIFPFQESADVIFNSALVYELAVLKVYAEPLLFQIPKGAAEYYEAKRLLKFLDYVLPLPTEGISKNSLVREFVGGSCFHV